MAYTCIDRAIALLRFRVAYRHIGRGSRVCDVGCGLETAFLEYAGDRIVAGIGVDEQVQDGIRGRWHTVHADIRTGLPLPAEQFDHVVMLAVLEHLAEPEHVLREVHRILAPGGSLILTWPSDVVDPILDLLHVVHLVSDEMESDKHQRRIPVETLKQMLRHIGFENFTHRRFEFGLNNLLIACR